RGLSGRILEAGIGTGRNFPFYPPGSEVVGIDLSPAMLTRAERRRSMAATVSTDLWPRLIEESSEVETTFHSQCDEARAKAMDTEGWRSESPGALLSPRAEQLYDE